MFFFFLLNCRSESLLDSVSVTWNVESFLSVLRVVYGCDVEISSSNFVPFNEVCFYSCICLVEVFELVVEGLLLVSWLKLKLHQV